MQNLKLENQVEQLKEDSKVIYLKPEYRDEAFLSQGKPFKKVILVKAFVFFVITALSMANLFTSLDGSYMLIGFAVVYHLFTFGMKVILRDQKGVNALPPKQAPIVHKGIVSEESMKVVKKYGNKYRKYKSDLKRHL